MDKSENSRSLQNHEGMEVREDDNGRQQPSKYDQGHVSGSFSVPENTDIVEEQHLLRIIVQPLSGASSRRHPLR